jgi:phospholipid/cholesterol/gamma-HCH transport system ATP-binding protein
MSEHVIEAHALSIGHGDKPLLRDLDFTVERGEVLVILGGSGCGKSTLLRHLIGLETPIAGRVEVSVARGAGGAPGFGVMFQSGALLGSLTVGENLALALEEWTKLPADAVNAMVQAKLRLVGLSGTEDKLPAELSGGMRKRAAIARAMILEPTLLFLDEPSAGLDPITAAELDQLILRLNRTLGMTIVMVTHELASIMQVGTRCLMLDKKAGGIIAVGTPEELANDSQDPRVVAFFNRTPLEEAS